MKVSSTKNKQFGVLKPQETNKPSTIFSDEQIGRFVAFAAILERIHRRLEYEGYTFEDGAINPPTNAKIRVKSKKPL